jgi:hypothetical protein
MNKYTITFENGVSNTIVAESMSDAIDGRNDILEVKYKGKVEPDIAGIKIGAEFNNCRGGIAIATAIEQLRLNEDIKVEDLNESFWQNDGATLVFNLKNPEPIMVAQVGKLGVEMEADEFDWKIGGANKIWFRLWWD